MDTTIGLALVLAVVFLGALFWLVVHARNQSQKHTIKTSIKPPEAHREDRNG